MKGERNDIKDVNKVLPGAPRPPVGVRPFPRSGSESSGREGRRGKGGIEKGDGLRSLNEKNSISV